MQQTHAVRRANQDKTKLLHPHATKQISESGIAAHDALIAFQQVLGAEIDAEELASRAWIDAFRVTRGRAIASSQGALSKSTDKTKRAWGKTADSATKLRTSAFERLKKPRAIDPQVDSDDER